MLLKITAMLLLIPAWSSSHPDTSSDEHLSSSLLNWSKFLFSKDGLLHSFSKASPNLGGDNYRTQQRHKSWDLNGILQTMGMNLRPPDAGLFDFFEIFDLSKMGLCNRDTCGDIYKFFDKIRSSDFMINLKTLFALLKDEEGLDLLKMILANPSMLKTFLGNGGGDNGGGVEDILNIAKPDKPDISFILDKKPPGDYDDYYFNSDAVASVRDEVITVNRPVHDVSIAGTNSNNITVEEDLIAGSGAEVIEKSQVDYYAYYYDQSESSGNMRTDVV